MTACRTDEDAIYVHRPAGPCAGVGAGAAACQERVQERVLVLVRRCGSCIEGSQLRPGDLGAAGTPSRRAHCPRAPVRRSAAARLAPPCPAAASCPPWRPPSAHVAAAPRPDDLPCQPPPSPTQPLPPCPLRCPALSAPLSEPTATPSPTLNAWPSASPTAALRELFRPPRSASSLSPALTRAQRHSHSLSPRCHGGRPALLRSGSKLVRCPLSLCVCAVVYPFMLSAHRVDKAFFWTRQCAISACAALRCRARLNWGQPPSLLLSVGPAPLVRWAIGQGLDRLVQANHE